MVVSFCAYGTAKDITREIPLNLLKSTITATLGNKSGVEKDTTQGTWVGITKGAEKDTTQDTAKPLVFTGFIGTLGN